MKTTIKRKILTLVLVTVLVVSLVLGATNVISLFQMRNQIKTRNEQLGQESATQSSATLLENKTEEVENKTVDISEYSNEQFKRIEAQVLVVANTLQQIYNDETGRFYNSQYITSPYGLLTEAEYQANLLENPRSALIHIKAQASSWVGDALTGELTREAQIDLNRISSLGVMLKETVENNDILAGCFVGTVTGIQFSADSATSSSSVGAINFGGAGGVQGRGWFTVTEGLSNGETAWTEIFVDASGRGASMNCSTPVYDQNGVLRAVVCCAALMQGYSDYVTSSTIGTTGKSFVVNKDGEIILTKDEIVFDQSGNPIYKKLSDLGDDNIKAAAGKIALDESGYTIGEFDGKEVLMAYSPIVSQPWAFVTIVEMDEILEASAILSAQINENTQSTISNLNASITSTVIIIVCIFIIMLAVVIVLSVRFATGLSRPIIQLKDEVGKISGGNLDVEIDVHTNDEVNVLGEAFNNMTISLKEYIANLSAVTAEKERIGAELNVATKIQSSMLPCIFPPYPDKDEFDVFATMNPAKEVGGDFYDFFLVDDDHFAVVIADVSGKGVPAALFMVIAKTLIKNQAQMGFTPAEVFTKVNNQLCENNEAGMFVTAWMGVFEISTGKFTYVNAGHERPIIKRNGGDWESVAGKAGFVLAGMEGIKYTQTETQLQAGDKVYLYTDGVVEATNANNELYGEERFLEFLNKNKDKNIKDLLVDVKTELDSFAVGVPQFDDVTMLILEILKLGGKK